MRIIKKYKNRKLYDSVTRKFIKLKDIFDMLDVGEKLKILDHSGEDITFEVVSKAQFNNSTYIPIDKNFFRKIIESVEKLLKGSIEEFSEVLFRLVDEKIIDGKYARSLGISIMNQIGKKHDITENEVMDFFKECGMVPVEDYEILREENERLRNELRVLKNT